MNSRYIAEEKLEKLKENLCNKYFRDINPENVQFNVEITTNSSLNKVYASVYRDFFRKGYTIDIGLPGEILEDNPSFQTLFTGGLAHEFGHIIGGHLGSYRTGLAIMLNILGNKLRPLRKVGRIMLRKLEEEADSIVKERGLSSALDAGDKLARKINGVIN